MNVEEKRDKVLDYCNETTCSECALNTAEVHDRFGVDDGVCFDIATASEKTLDEALEKIDNNKIERMDKEIQKYCGKQWHCRECCIHEICTRCKGDFRHNEKECKEAYDTIVETTLKANGVYDCLEDISDSTESTESTEPTELTNDIINHPSHYTHGGMECIDEMLLVFGKEAVKHFCLLNSWKYRKRCLFKHGEEDLKKADWYLSKYKELCDGNETN